MTILTRILGYRQAQISSCLTDAEQINDLLEEPGAYGRLNEQERTDLIRKARWAANCPHHDALRSWTIEFLENPEMFSVDSRLLTPHERAAEIRGIPSGDGGREATIAKMSHQEFHALVYDAVRLEQMGFDLGSHIRTLLNFVEFLGWFTRDHDYAA